MNFEDLDCRQHQVVDAVIHSDDSLLVLGGPGTGKTTTALWSARAFLENSKGNLSRRALFLTFSRSAVSQIMARSPGVISGYEDKVEVTTFHSLAYRLIGSFGRYAGYGATLPSVQTEARGKLLGYDNSKLQYNDLVPGALAILERSPHVAQILGKRWGLVICDEAQDTNEIQWDFLLRLASRKLLLLGDPNQMIYTFIPGVSPERFRKMREWADREIELNPRSHRDPSGAIPALAEAVRQRQFQNDAVLNALRDKRLIIHFDTDEADVPDLLSDIIKTLRQRGSRDVGIFVHSNAAVAELAKQLDEAGINYVLIGIPEAYSEALGSMAAQCAFALGLASDEDVRRSLGLFLTASLRRAKAPLMARALIGEAPLPELVDQAVQRLEDSLMEASQGTIGDLAEIATKSWEGIGIQSSYRPWRNASAHFIRLVRPIQHVSASAESLGKLLEVVERSQVEALIDRDYSEQGRIKLMNYHQTKGREADAVVHLFRQDDYFGREREPYEGTSRLLNVAISRGKQQVVIILPSSPHPLVEPFVALKGYQTHY